MDTQEQKPQSLMEAMEYFSDPLVCHRFITGLRWPNGVECPYCHSKNIGHIESRQMFQCKDCRKQFSLKRGTIFEDSPLGLKQWILAMWLVANCKNGISSYEVSRDLHITQKSAWFLLSRIRLAMESGTFKKLSGIIEADETFIGGKAKNMHAHKRAKKIKGTGHAGKVIVMGIMERGGEMRATVIPTTKRSQLDPLVRENVEEGSEVHTDALPSYESLGDAYDHKSVDHKQCFVQGNVHTNSAENFWSLLKRTIRGTYVSVEPFHLFRYVEEQSFRFNNRKTTDWERFKKLLGMISGKRLTYAKLIASEPVV